MTEESYILRLKQVAVKVAEARFWLQYDQAPDNLRGTVEIIEERLVDIHNFLLATLEE